METPSLPCTAHSPGSTDSCCCVCRYGKVSRAGTDRQGGDTHVSARCGWSGRARKPHLLHGWREGHRLGTLLSVVSFLGSLLDGTGARPAGPQWHRLLRAHLASSLATLLSASTGKLCPPHLVPASSVHVRSTATHLCVVACSHRRRCSSRTGQSCASSPSSQRWNRASAYAYRNGHAGSQRLCWE